MTLFHCYVLMIALQECQLNALHGDIKYKCGLGGRMGATKVEIVGEKLGEMSAGGAPLLFPAVWVVTDGEGEC